MPGADVGAGRRRGALARHCSPPRCAPPAGCGRRRGGLHQPRLYSGPWAAGRGRECGTGRAASATRQGGRRSGAAGRGAPRRGGTSRAPRHPAPRHLAPHGSACPHPAPRDSAPATPQQPSALAAGIPGTLGHLLTPPHHGTPAPHIPRPGARLPRAPVCASPLSASLRVALVPQRTPGHRPGQPRRCGPVPPQPCPS